MAWLVTIVSEEPKRIEANEVPIVKEYLDVFPEDLSDLPPDREIEFTIDLVPGIEPISIPLYQMAPIKLKELKE